MTGRKETTREPAHGHGRPQPVRRLSPFDPHSSPDPRVEGISCGRFEKDPGT